MESGDSTVRRQLAGIAVAVAVLVAASVLLSPDVVVRRVGALVRDPVAFALLVAALYLFRPVAAWPVTPLAVVVGYGYGVALGVPVALAGAVGTCVIPYAVARHFRTDSGLVGRVGESGRSLFETTGAVRGVVAARLIPIPSDVVTYAAGVSGVPLRALLLGTAVGELPWTVAAVLAGSSMETLSVGGVDAVGPPLVVAAALGAVVLVAGPMLGERLGNEPGENRERF